MAGPDRPAEVIEGLAEALVREMRHVENHVQAFHLGEQFGPWALNPPVAFVPCA